MSHSTQHGVLFIGKDDALAYLITRYGQRCGLDVHVESALPDPSTLSSWRPLVLWFSTVQFLEACQPRGSDLSYRDVPVIVFSSPADEERAGEMGADYHAFHPLTYEDFLEALLAVGVSVPDGR